MTAQIIPFARRCVWAPPVRRRRKRKEAVERPAVQVDGLPIRLTTDEAVALWKFAKEQYTIKLDRKWTMEERHILIALTSLRLGLEKSLPKAIRPA